MEHLGYPAEPQHERRHICREIFTLDKWTSITAYGVADQGAPVGPEQPEEPVDIPAHTQTPAPAVASSEPTPEVPPSTPQATPQPPPVIPPTPEPSQAPPFVDQPMPPKKPPIREAEAVEPSSPQHHPPTI